MSGRMCTEVRQRRKWSTAAVATLLLVLITSAVYITPKKQYGITTEDMTSRYLTSKTEDVGHMTSGTTGKRKAGSKARKNKRPNRFTLADCAKHLWEQVATTSWKWWLSAVITLLLGAVGLYFRLRRQQQDYASIPLDDDMDPDQVRERIRNYRTDILSRIEDKFRDAKKRLKRFKASVMSIPMVIRVVVFTTRASFAYDYSSDVLVAKSLHKSGNPIWAKMVMITMVLPYILLLGLLCGVATKRISKRVGLPACLSTCVWLAVGIPSCVVADIALNLYYLTSTPSDPQLFHYMTLRSLVELVEGGFQSLFQTYISVRLWNPGRMFPDVGGTHVDPWILGSSIAVSMHSSWDAYNTLAVFAKYQAGGSICRFIQHMANLGEGLAPSNYFVELRSRRSVGVELAGNLSEIEGLSRLASESDTLEELTISNASLLEEIQDTKVNMKLRVQRFMRAPRLKSFALRGAKDPSVWTDAVRQAAKSHRCLEIVGLQGVEEQIQSEKVRRIRSQPLLSAISCEDHGAIAEILLSELDTELLAEALSDAVAADSQGMVRSLLLSSKGLDAMHKKIDLAGISGASHSPLHEACARGSEEAMKLLVMARSELNGQDSMGYTPLYYASYWNRVGSVSQMLHFRADVDVGTGTPLKAAAINGNNQILTLLLQFRSDANLAGAGGATPVFMAAQEGHNTIVQLLVSSNAEVNKACDNGNTPLIMAANEGHNEIAQLLVSSNADVNKANNEGGTPLYMAAQRGYKEVVQLLVSSNAEVNKATDDGGTPVLIAAENGHSTVVQLLVSCSADVNTAKNDGITPLWMAAHNGHEVVVASLAAGRANVDAVRQSDGITPLWMAAHNGHEIVVASLAAGRANVDAVRPSDGWAPLEIAASQGHDEIVSALLQSRALVNVADDTGGTPVSWAAYNGCETMVRVLAKAKADLEKADLSGATPLSSAAQNGHDSAVLELIKAGVDVNKLAEQGDTALSLARGEGHRAVIDILLATGAA